MQVNTCKTYGTLEGWSVNKEYVVRVYH